MASISATTGSSSRATRQICRSRRSSAIALTPTKPPNRTDISSLAFGRDAMVRFLRSALVLVSVVAALAFVAADANARAGGGSSFGSRGTRTFSPPAATQTAPNTAAPIQRWMTQRAPSSSPAAGGWFGRPGLFGGLAGGFLGAGLLGLLFGYGLFGGLGGFASVLGLLLQLALIFFVARLIWGWYQRRHTPAY